MSINAEINPSTKIVAKHVTMHNVSKSDVGLSNVDNTSDADKPISTLTQAALDLKANQSTTYTKTEVDTEIANLVDSAPENLNTLNELAAALNDDNDFATALTNQVSLKLDKTNNLSDLNDAAVARTNLGLGDVTNLSQSQMFNGPTFTGKVGIGISSPDRALHIKTSTTDDDGQHPLRVEGASSSIVEIKAGNDTSFSGIDFADTTIESGNASSHPGSIVYNHSNNSMIFDTNNATRMTITNSGRIGIGTTTPTRELEVDGKVLVERSSNFAASLNVTGPITVTHDLFKDSGQKDKFGDNSNHFHDVVRIDRITQQVGKGTSNERVQEKYYAIENNSIKNDKAAFWNWNRISREIASTDVDLSNLVGWNISPINNSPNRSANFEVAFPADGAENTDITFTNETTRAAALNTLDLLQITIEIDFEGAIVAATLFSEVAGVTSVNSSNDSADIVIYGGNYKTTGNIAPGNLTVTENFSIEKIDTSQKLDLASGTGIDVLSDSTRKLSTDTFSLTFASAHNLELNDTITVFTKPNTGGFKPAEVAFVKEVVSTTEAKFVYGRAFEPDSNLALSDIDNDKVLCILRGSLDGLHRFTAGDLLFQYNADNEGRYKSYQIGPGSEVGADCIAIGKNVYNKDASTIKIGYDNAMLDVKSDGIVVAGKIDATGTIAGTVAGDLTGNIITQSIAGAASGGAPSPIVIEGGSTSSSGALGGGTLVLEGGESPNNTAYHGNIVIGPFHTGGINIGQSAVTTTQVFGEFRVDSDTSSNPFTLKVDTANDRVGINKDIPSEALEVNNTILAKGDNSGVIKVQDGGGTNQVGTLSQIDSVTAITTQNDTANGEFAIKQYDGSTTTVPLHIGATGKVGIGKTADSGVELDVLGDIQASGSISADDIAVDENFRIQGSAFQSGLLTCTDGVVELSIQNVNANGTFKINQIANAKNAQLNDPVGSTTTTTTPFSIDSNGNVGIGTTSPGGLLELKGNFENDKALVFNSTNGTGTEHYFRTHGTNGNELVLYSNTTRLVDFNSNGVGISNKLSIGDNPPDDASEALDVTGNIIASGSVTSNKIITKEIQCEVGSAVGTGADAQPINYDAKEHRFRDFDAQPTNLMVISKFNGYTGARIGINKEPSSSNAVALHVVAGKNASTNVEDLALKVIGGAFFDDFIRIGHYTDATRPTSPTNGTVIYNQQHHEFQGFVGGGTGWQKFNMSAVST